MMSIICVLTELTSTISAPMEGAVNFFLINANDNIEKFSLA